MESDDTLVEETMKKYSDELYARVNFMNSSQIMLVLGACFHKLMADIAYNLLFAVRPHGEST